MNFKSSLVIGLSFIVGLSILGYVLGNSLLQYKLLERTVQVKGLAQKEVKADIVIWPITYIQPGNDLSKMYTKLEDDTKKIQEFLKNRGFTSNEISISAPSVVDKIAQDYINNAEVKFRYNAKQTITLYTNKLDIARKSMLNIIDLGKSGITFKANDYNNLIEYKFSKLNSIKPLMIEEATKNARLTAQKFAEDSKSKLGKIKKARQGQFSIYDRDKNTPFIKKIRIVTTVEYYLSD